MDRGQVNRYTERQRDGKTERDRERQREKKREEVKQITSEVIAKQERQVVLGSYSWYV